MIAKRLWQTHIDGTIRRARLSVMAEHVCVLVRRDRSPALTAINKFGEVAWDREFEFDSIRAFGTFGQFLYLDGTTIRKLDPTSGEVVGERDLVGRVQIAPPNRFGPTYRTSQEIIGVDADTLETVWNWKQKAGSFIAAGDTLLRYEESGEIAIVNVADNMKVKRLRGPGKEKLGLGVHLVDDLLVQIYWMARFAVDLRTGELAWRVEDDRHGTHERIMFHASSAYSAWHDLKAIDLRTGQVSWCSKLPHRVETVPYVDSGKVYVGTKDGGVHAVDAQTGRVLWSFDVDYDPVAVQPRSRGEVVVLGWEVVSCYQVEEN